MMSCIVLDAEDLLIQKGYSDIVIRRLHIRGLPKDATIKCVYYEMAHQCVFAVIHSEEFAPIPMMERLPIVEHDVFHIYVKFPVSGPIVTISGGEYRLRRSRLWRWIKPVVEWFLFTFATQSDADDDESEKSADATRSDQITPDSVDTPRPRRPLYP